MKVLSIVSQKGGVGKTTLATALAVEAARDGKSVVVFDLDPQASASFWSDTRQGDDIAITALPSSRLAHMLQAAKDGGCDLAIIDPPPMAKDIAYEATQSADFVLVPTRPAVLDVMAMSKTLNLVRHFDKPFAVVLNFCPPQGREINDALEVIDQLGATLCPVRVGLRVAFSRAQQTGQAAQEIDPEGKAAGEIEKLYKYACMHLYQDTGKEVAHGKKRASSRS